MAVLSKLSDVCIGACVFTLDLALCLANLVLPQKKVGAVVPEGCPGYQGNWPEYRPPAEGDSRCSCPALNVLANHGILPRDGKNISFKELNHAVRTSYNFAPSFCLYVPRFAAGYLGRSYSTGTFDLHELDGRHGGAGIEHDASLVRHDPFREPDQSKIAVDLVEGLLGEATGSAAEEGATGSSSGGILTVPDLARYSSKRRAESRRDNPEFQLNFTHKMFGSSNASTMLTTLGGRVSDLRTWLLEERFPDGWEPRLRSRFGLTFAAFNVTVFGVERRIDERKAAKQD